MMKISANLAMQLLAVVILVNAMIAFSFLPATTTSAVPRTIVRVGAHDDEPDIIAKRIVVSGDVQGGYYRSCVLNEVSLDVWKITFNLHRSLFG